MTNPVPELTNYAANAYNARDGRFLGRPVFIITYNEGKKIDWPTGPRDIPDQLSVNIATNLFIGAKSILLESERDYDRWFSASVEAEYSGVTYSGSVGSSLLYHGDLFTAASSQYALNFASQSILEFERIDKSSLHPDFLRAVQALPPDISTVDNQQRYFRFFDDYGTHYASSATLGGTIVMETEIRDTLTESSQSLEVASALELGYKGIIKKGELDVSVAFKESKYLRDHEASLRLSLNVIGGHLKDNLSDWIQSIYATPSLLLNLTLPRGRNGRPQTVLKAISDLIEDHVIASNIQSLFGLYIKQDEFKDGLLTAPRLIEFERVYDTTDGDGFVVCMINGWPDHPEWAHGDIQAIENPESGQSVVRANASWNYDTHHNQYISYAALTMPTSSKTSYAVQAKSDTGPGGQQKLIQFIGFGDIGDQAFGAWGDIELNAEITAPNDGFVVAYVDCGQRDGIYGQVKGEQKLDKDYVTIAGASQQFHYGDGHFVSANSFCMPVRKSMQFRVRTAGNSVYKAFFLPISKSLASFEPFLPREKTLVYQAKTDGFLVAYLSTNIPSDRGFVEVYSYPEKHNLTDRGKVAATSIHADVSCNTVMIPIRKNAFYQASFTKDYGNPLIELRWMPLIPSA